MGCLYTTLGVRAATQGYRDDIVFSHERQRRLSNFIFLLSYV